MDEARETRKNEGLEIEEDDDFQRRDWSFERGGWIAMLLFMAAALSGLFGGGPLSQKTAGAPGSALWVDHERFTRWNAPEELHVHVGSGGVHGGKVLVWLDRDFVDAHEIEDITPEPLSTEASADRITYELRATADPVVVTFHLKAEHWGKLTGTAGIRGGPEVSFSQIVYP